jgi:hypothetical protein
MKNVEPGAARRSCDMSPEAIDRRLREVGQLYRLGMSIRTARRVGTVREQSLQATVRTDGPGDTTQTERR